MITRKAAGELLEELLYKTPMEAWGILMEMKDNDEIRAFATFEVHDQLTALEVQLEDCIVVREKNE